MVIKKKGPSGNAKNYITRTKAVRKLQISLPDFRRLCIFKGIYPREPRNKKKASKGATSATTFYYTKDIQYLLHEPLIAKFREHKALGKKIGRALGRGEVGDAARLEKTLTPKIALDHIIKERYPTFVDALRDLDDALSMLFLFSILPTGKYVSARITELCKRLCLEFEHYLIVSHSLRKSFLSIKGIYYQATIQGQDILWLVPYKFVQNVGGDIDFRIMSTFIEFYTTLLGFVNFRLYTSVGLVYPPKFNATSDEKGAELGAFTLEGKAVTTTAINSDRAITNGDSAMGNTETSAAAQAEADKLANEQTEVSEEQNEVNQGAQPEEDAGAIDKFEATADDADILDQPATGSSEAASLFAPFTFFLARETPRQPLEFLLKAFGCKRVGWEETMGDGAYVTDESDPSITHHIVDKPQVAHDTNAMEESDDEPRKLLWPYATVPERTYVQPQWVWDCINQGQLLPPSEYFPGASLPPHLSPWVKPKKGAYDPTLSLAEQEPLGEAEEHMHDVDEPAKSAKSQGKLTAAPSNDEEDSKDNGMEVASDDEEDEDEDEEDDFGGFSETEDAPLEEEVDEIPTSEDEEDTSTQHQRELLAESQGRPAPVPKTKNPANEARKKNVKRKMEEEEERQRQMMMMSRKKKKLAERMQFGNAKRDEEAEKLRGKRRRIEREKGKA